MRAGGGIPYPTFSPETVKFFATYTLFSAVPAPPITKILIFFSYRPRSPEWRDDRGVDGLRMAWLSGEEPARGTGDILDY